MPFFWIEYFDYYNYRSVTTQRSEAHFFQLGDTAAKFDFTFFPEQMVRVSGEEKAGHIMCWGVLLGRCRAFGRGGACLCLPPVDG